MTLKVDQDGLSGHIKYRIPSKTERLKFVRETSYELRNGELVENNIIDRAILMHEKIGSYIIEVSCDAEGKKIDSIEEFSKYKASEDTFAKMYESFLHGVSLGKP